MDFQSMTDKYEVGRATVHDVISAQDRIHQIKTKLTSINLKLQEARLSVQQTTGKLLENWHVQLSF